MQTIKTGDYIIRKHDDDHFDRLPLNTPGATFQRVPLNEVTPELRALFEAPTPAYAAK